MTDEQNTRFESMRDLVSEAKQAVDALNEIARSHFNAVQNDSAVQAEHLQRMQQYAGTAVQALTQTANIARHARSYQAQAHQANSGDVPH